MNKRIIAFGSHHDDIEIRAGGTLEKYIEMGYEVLYIVAIDSIYVNPNYVSEDGKIYSELSHKEILDIREKEAREGAATLGINDPVFLHLKPSFYWNGNSSERPVVNFLNTEEDDYLIEKMKSLSGSFFCLQAAKTPACVQMVCDIFEDFDPEIILTQQPNDLHSEHYSVASLVFKACKLLAQRKKEIRLFAWEMGSNGKMLRFVPDVIIDITNYFERKIEAVRKFKSQVNDPTTHIKFVEESARFWGKQIGVNYAEPFSEFLVSQNTVGFDLSVDDFEKSNSILPYFDTKF